MDGTQQITPGTEPGVNTTTGGETKQEIDYEKLDDIIQKGLDTKLNGILKSYAEQNKLNFDELKTMYGTHNAEKNEEKAKENKAYKDLETKLETMIVEMKANKFDTAFRKEATAAGFNEDQIPYLKKLVSVDDVYDEKTGEFNSEKIKESLSLFGKAFNNQTANFGYKGSKNDEPEDLSKSSAQAEDEIMKIFGLKTKK